MIALLASVGSLPAGGLAGAARICWGTTIASAVASARRVALDAREPMSLKLRALGMVTRSGRVRLEQGWGHEGSANPRQVAMITGARERRLGRALRREERSRVCWYALRNEGPRREG